MCFTFIKAIFRHQLKNLNNALSTVKVFKKNINTVRNHNICSGLNLIYFMEKHDPQIKKPITLN